MTGVGSPTSQGRSVGSTLTLPGAISAELMSSAFDFVWIDLEHAALGPLDAQEMILGVQVAGGHAFVRLPADEYGLMTTMLDAGADGLVLADVQDAEDIVAAARELAHPPKGNRGYGPRRAGLRSRFNGTGGPIKARLWAQVESVDGVANSLEIASLDEVDAVVIGTADLSFAVGTPLQVSSPQMLEALEQVRRATQSAGTCYGLAGALDGLPRDVLATAEIFVHSTDARLAAGATDDAARWLRELEQPTNVRG